MVLRRFFLHEVMFMSIPLKSLQDLLITQTIPVAFLADVLEGLDVNSESSRKLLSDEGLLQSQLALGGHRLSVLEYSGFVQRVMKESDDLFLGFLDNPVPVKAFGVFAMGAVGCRSLQSLVDYGNLYFSMFTDQFSWRLHREPGVIRLELKFDHRRTIRYRFIFQSMLLIWLRLISWFIGEDIKPRAIHFRFPETKMDEHLRYLFGENLVFSSDTNQLVFEASDIDVPFSATQEEVRQMLRNNHNMMLVRISSEPFTKQTRRLLVLNRNAGWLKQSEIAEKLGMSENLYWRKLRKEGTNYNQILAALKRDFAMRLLADPGMSLEQIAASLHFADISAFDKAFRKWLGQPPGQYRKRLMVG